MRRLRIPSNARRFAQAERGVSAVEFAIAFPMLLVLMMVGTQVVTYVNAVRKVEQLASSISEMISQAAPPNTSTTVATVNATDLHFAYDSAMVIFPYLMKDAPRQNLAWWQDIAIDSASIQFNQTATTCAGQTDQSPCYTPYVVWATAGYNIGNNRPCSILPPPLPPSPKQQVANDNAAPSKTTLPRSVFGPGSLIVVDVVFTFQPTFASRVLPSIRIARSVYVQPRYASLIKYDMTTTDGIATTCPGF